MEMIFTFYSSECKLPLLSIFNTVFSMKLFRFKKFPLRVSDSAARVRSAMCKLWTNFAKYGDPTPVNQRLDVNWSPVKHCDDKSTYHLDYLYISSDGIQMQRNPDEKRMEFWRKTFDKYNGGFLKANL